MNYSHFASLGYVSRHDALTSHPYRLVNPVARKREKYSGLRHLRSGSQEPPEPESPYVINYNEAGDETSFLNFLRAHPVAFIWFHAVWCGHCVVMKKDYSQAAEAMAGQVSFIKVDAEKYPQLSRRYDITSYPTLKLFKNGVPVALYDEQRNATNFIKWLQKQ